MDEQLEMTFDAERCRVIYNALQVYRIEILKPEYCDFPDVQSTLFVIDQELQRFAEFV